MAGANHDQIVPSPGASMPVMPGDKALHEMNPGKPRKSFVDKGFKQVENGSQGHPAKRKQPSLMKFV